MSAVYVGTAGWAIPKNVRDAFAGPGGRLQQYARVLPCVEINSTFHRAHRTATYERWAATVPEAFRFSLKIPKAITHAHRLIGADALLEAFVRETAALGTKRGVLLVQLPPSLTFHEPSVDAFFDALRGRYAGAVACEPRHATWFEPDAERVLASYRVARVAADPPPVPAAARPGAFRAFAYYRRHGSPQTYYSTYTAENVAAFASALDLDAAEVWCIFDNTALGGATGNALQLADLVRPRTGRTRSTAPRAGKPEVMGSIRLAEISDSAMRERRSELARSIAGGDPACELTDARVLCSGLADRAGTPVVGRGDEARLLRAAGYRDLPFGRLYEGHVNALQLIARCGTAAQWDAAARDAELGRLFGVWNTGPADGVRIAEAGNDGLRLAGRKTFCSGAGRVGGALVTAKTGDGAQMVVVAMERELPTIDRSFWLPLGMERSDSYAVDFTGVLVRPAEVLGAPGDYERSPWFQAGAARFVAVQTGGIERLVAEYAAWVREGERSADPLALARLGTCAVAARTACAWTDACATAWSAYDRGELAVPELLVTVDAARIAVERAALDVAEAVERGVGARGLLEPAPFSRLVRDLRMYLRQPAPDQALMRVGQATLAGDTQR